jgi:outer membrane lipoprotein SlyB
MKKLFVTTGLALTMIMATGCADKGISKAHVGQSMTVKPGIVQSVQIVALNTDGVGNTLGAVVGAAAGAAAGHQVGGGTGQDVATIAGGVLGAVVGGAAGDRMDTNQGQQIVVKLDNGQTVATVLNLNGATPQVMVGQAVNVLYSGSKIVNITAR